MNRHISKNLSILKISAEMLVNLGYDEISNMLTHDNYNTLSLTHQRITIDSCKKIIEVLNSNKTINILLLDGCGINDTFMFEIAKYIQNNSVITELDLSFNNFTSIGANSLFESLKYNNTLQTLILNCNFIQFDERAFMNNLKKNVLGNNIICPDAIVKIGTVLRQNESLELLTLSCCKVDSGVSEIFEELRFNSVLKHLDLSYNKLNSNAVNKICEILPYTNIIELELGETGLNIDDLVKILCCDSKLNTLGFDIIVKNEYIIKIINALENNYTITNLYENSKHFEDILNRNKNIFENKRFMKTKSAQYLQ